MSLIKKVSILICSIVLISCGNDNDTQEFPEVLFRVDNQTNFLLTQVLIDNTEFTNIQPQTISSYSEFIPFGPPENFPPSFFTVNTTDESLNNSWVVDYFAGATIENGFYTLTLTMDIDERIRGNYTRDE